MSSADHVCPSYFSGACVQFTIIDATTGQPICDATVTSSGAIFGGPCEATDAGRPSCSYDMVVDELHTKFSVSRSGYITQTVEVPTDPECGHLVGTYPAEVKLVPR